MDADSKPIDVAIAIIVRDGLVLICQRLPGAKLGGFWEFPGGKCESGETAADCARREVREEVELDVMPETELPVIEHEYVYGRVRLHPFLCRGEEGQPKAIACQQCLWVAPEDLSQYQFPPANQELVAWLTENLRGYQGELDNQESKIIALNSLRIRKVAQLHRGTTRVASYFLIVAGACGVIAVDLMERATKLVVRNGASITPIIYGAAALALIVLGFRMWRRFRQLSIEARRRNLPNPETTPDFSTLSDGSQVVRNLEKLS